MLVEVRPVSRLRGPDPVRVMAQLGPVIDTLCASTVDLSRLTVVCDWIQYRANFRDVAELRPVLASRVPSGAEVGDEEPREGQPPDERTGDVALELALDLRRCNEADLPAAIGQLLREHADPGVRSRVAIEPWATLARSCIWRFNAL